MDPAKESPAAFFALTFLLSVPFYVLNALAFLNMIGGPATGPVYMILFTIAPVASAYILTYRRCGARGVRELLGRVFDFKRIADVRWYAAAILLSPLFFLLALTGFVFSGTPIPPALAPLIALPAIFALFFVMAAGEEVGWMGYAFEPMHAQHGALRAALLLGLIWALWHLPFFVFVMPDAFAITAQLLTLVGTRVLLAWLFNNTGKSVFAVILFHAVDNAALVTFPEISAVRPWGPTLLCGLVMVAAVTVTLLWGPASLARYRFGAARHPETDK